MKQVSQRLRDGRIEVLEVPPPQLRAEGVLVGVRASLVSAGTERKKVETGRQSLAGKARSRPDQLRQVLEKAKRDGVVDTVQAVRARLEQPSPLGYSAAGIVLAAGERVADLVPGDRVACAGAGYASHAEIDYVPANLAVPVPEGVDLDQAAFATVGSIALHGIRQADVRVAERVAVIGLGLVGQLAGQILRASGCRVVGIDLDAELVRLALATGGADVAYPRGDLDGDLPREAQGCDAVVVTAATASADPVELAARLCRDRGRIVVVGDVGLQIPRAAFYEKELELRLSRSYGPGRYDPEYEERGLDYPVGYVRWTERRNMAAFLDLVAAGQVVVEPLIGERVPVEEAPAAYDRLVSAEGSRLGILISYAGVEKPAPTPVPTGRPAVGTARAAGVIGAGSFATRVLIPGLVKAGFSLDAVASASGLSARGAADRAAIQRTLAPDELIADDGVGLVAIATRHDSHASLALAGLRAGKAVYVEKPPALSEDELEELRAARRESGRPLAVGFNRRHAPLARELRDQLRATGGPLELLLRVNAGALPPGHWANDPIEGGGRLLGEGCHFVDLACWLVGTLPARVSCTMRPEPGRPLAAAESFSVALDFPDGSLASLVYAVRGSTGLGKEYVEGHAGGRSAVLDDFKTLTVFGEGRPSRRRSRKSDKGHEAQFAALRRWLDGTEEPEGPDPLETMAVTLTALRAAEAGATLRFGD
jgi:predicted dehydrogenase